MARAEVAQIHARDRHEGPVMGRRGLFIRRGALRRSSARLLVFLVLLATLTKASGLGSLLWEPADVASLAVLILSVALFLPLCLTSQRYLPAFWLGGVILAALLLAHIGFVKRSGTAMNVNMLFAYFPALVFLPLARSGVSIDRILRYLAWMSAIYVLVYALGYRQIAGAALEASSQVLKIGDVERGPRIFFAPAFAAFAFFFLWEWRRGNPVLRLLLMIVAVGALWLSNYRTFLAIFLLVVLLRGARTLNPLVRLLIFAVVLTGYVVLLSGLVLPQWEPFAYFAKDGSGFARLLAYRHITPFVLDNWLSGVGIAGSNISLQHYLRTPTFYSVYPTDLGPIGPLFVFGIGGLAAYILLTYYMIVSRLPVRFGAEHPERMALHLTAMTCGIAGIISPSFMLETNSLFPALMMAGWIQLRRVRPNKHFYFRRWGIVSRRDGPQVAQGLPPVLPLLSVPAPMPPPNNNEKTP